MPLNVLARNPWSARRSSRRPHARRFSIWRWLLGTLLVLFTLLGGTVLALRWVPPPTTAFMLQSKLKPVQYDWVPADEIPDVMRRAVIASEDQKFWDHGGFDFDAMGEALERNRKSRKRRGASTISQQTAKNLFLWPGGGYFRKGVEAGFTVLIEALWPKERILEVYLNIAEFGPGIYGVEAAARAHFRKSATRLTANEAARLAAVLPSPRRWSARNPGPYVQSRVGWILGQMGYRSRTTPAEEPDLPAWLGDDGEADVAPGWEPLAPEESLQAPAAEDAPQTRAIPFDAPLAEPIPVEPEPAAPVEDEASSSTEAYADPPAYESAPGEPPPY